MKVIKMLKLSFTTKLNLLSLVSLGGGNEKQSCDSNAELCDSLL